MINRCWNWFLDRLLGEPYEDESDNDPGRDLWEEKE